MELKQGPNSPLIHTGFHHIAGKYSMFIAMIKSFHYQPQNIQKDDLRESLKSLHFTKWKDKDGWQKNIYF